MLKAIRSDLTGTPDTQNTARAPVHVKRSAVIEDDSALFTDGASGLPAPVTALSKASSAPVFGKLTPYLGTAFEVADQVQSIDQAFKGLGDKPLFPKNKRVLLVSAAAAVGVVAQLTTLTPTLAHHSIAEALMPLAHGLYDGAMTGIQVGSGAVLAFEGLVKLRNHKGPMVVAAGATLGAASGVLLLVTQEQAEEANIRLPSVAATAYTGALMGARLGGAAMFAGNLLLKMVGRDTKPEFDVEMQKLS